MHDTDHLKVKNRRTCKVDRCFVTCDMDFFEFVVAKWDRISFFTQSINCGEKMYMKRFMDIRLDPHRRISSTAKSRVEPCETGLIVPLCNIHGLYRSRRTIQTAPAPVSTSKMLSPREPPKARVKHLDATPCTGRRWCPWAVVEDRPYILYSHR